MAEVIGVVASGISIGALAAQITSSVIKLKSFWDQIRDAPEDIRDLIEELEALTYILVDIEDDQHRNYMSNLSLDPTSTSRCLHQCKETVARLKELIDTLDMNIEGKSIAKRKWASARVAMKKNKLAKYKAKLQIGVGFLSLSHQCYTRTMIQLQPDIIVSRLSQIPAASQVDSSNDLHKPGDAGTRTATLSDQYWTISNCCGSFHYYRRLYYHSKQLIMDKTVASQGGEDILVQYRAPRWLINRAWAIRAGHASSWWNIKLRTYNIIPKSSIVFSCLRSDNHDGLQDLFSRREASPFDCDEDGLTLLHHALYARCSLPVCRLLIREGADVDHMGTIETPTSQCISLNSNGGVEKTEENLEIMRLLLLKSESPPEIDEYNGLKEGFQIFQQVTDPLYYERPFSDRVEIALTMGYGFFEPTVIEIALGGSMTVENINCIRAHLGRTRLHSIASHLAHVHWWTEFDSDEVGEEVSLQAWRDYHKRVLALRPSLHSVSDEGRTPFLELIRNALIIFSWKDKDGMSWLVHLWLLDLKDSGIDLNQYGQTEYQLYTQEPRLPISPFTCYIPDDGKGEHADFGLKWLSFGSMPSDWDIILERLNFDIGERERCPPVPGGWIDDDEDGEYNDDDLMLMSYAAQHPMDYRSYEWREVRSDGEGDQLESHETEVEFIEGIRPLRFCHTFESKGSAFKWWRRRVRSVRAFRLEHKLDKMEEASPNESIISELSVVSVI